MRSLAGQEGIVASAQSPTGIRRPSAARAALAAALVVLCGCDAPPKTPAAGTVDRHDGGAPTADASAIPLDGAANDGGAAVDAGTVADVDGSALPPPVGGDLVCALSEAEVFPLATAQVWVGDGPALAANNEAGVVAWIGTNAGHPRLSVLAVPADPARDLRAIDVGVGMSGQRHPAIAESSDGFVIVWRDDVDGDYELMASAIDAEALSAASAARITENAVDDGPPMVGSNGLGQLLLAWQRDPDGAARGQIAVLDGDGHVLVSEQANAELDEILGLPVVGPVGNAFGVLWADSSGDVYLRRYGADGRPVAAKAKLNAEPIATGTLSLARGVDGSGTAAYDVRVGGIRPEIRFRTFDRNGDPTSVVRVVTPIPASGQFSSMASLGGNLAVTYRAMHGADGELLALFADGRGGLTPPTTLASVTAPATATIVRASPDGRRVYVAWANDGRMMVARIRCD